MFKKTLYIQTTVIFKHVNFLLAYYNNFNEANGHSFVRYHSVSRLEKQRIYFDSLVI